MAGRFCIYGWFNKGEGAHLNMFTYILKLILQYGNKLKTLLSALDLSKMVVTHHLSSQGLPL